MSTTVFKLKKSSIAGRIPDSSDLAYGELAINYADGLIYYKNSSNEVKNIASTIIEEFDYLQAAHGGTVTFTVTVASKDSTHRYNGQGSGSGYKIDGVFSPFLTLTPGRTYRFDQSDSSNSGHPLAFYYDAAKSVGYSTNVTTNGNAGNAGAYTEITITDSTPTVLHYQCTAHGYMGNSVQTNSRTLTGFDTDDLSEGSSNQYFTQSRARGSISHTTGSANYNSGTGVITIPSTTSHVTEGTNLYYTDARVNSYVDSAYVQARQLNFDQLLDSSEVIALVDSAYVQARVTLRDSAFVTGIIDSDYVLARADSDYIKTVQYGDDESLQFGANPDLTIKHNSSQNKSQILASGAGLLTLGGQSIVLGGLAGTTTLLKTTHGAGVELYYAGSEKLETTTVGVGVSGKLTADSAAFTNLTLDGQSVDSAWVQARQVDVRDSAFVTGIVDSAYISARASSFDSGNATGLIDSAYIQARQTDIRDSSFVTEIIDSAYINARASSFDSDNATGLIDSAYVSARAPTGSNSFGKVAVSGQTTVQADSSSDVLTLGAGSGITLTTTPGTDTVTIAAAGAGSLVAGTANNVTANSYTGDSSTTQFTLSSQPADKDDVVITINGVTQHVGTYTLAGRVITLDSAPVTGDEVEMRVHEQLSANLSLRDYKSYIYQPSSSTTTFSDSDINGNVLTYDIDKLEVYINGARVVTGLDYTANNGTSVVLIGQSLDSGDTIEIVSLAAAALVDPGVAATDSDLTTTSADQIVDTFSKTSFRTVKYVAQIEHDSSSSYHAEEILLTHNGTNVAMTTYGRILLDSNLGTFDADIAGDTVRLKFTPTKTNTSTKLRKIQVKA